LLMGIRDVKFMNAKAKIDEVLLILGIGLFVGGAICYITGQLPAEQILGIVFGGISLQDESRISSILHVKYPFQI